MELTMLARGTPEERGPCFWHCHLSVSFIYHEYGLLLFPTGSLMSDVQHRDQVAWARGACKRIMILPLAVVEGQIFELTVSLLRRETCRLLTLELR